MKKTLPLLYLLTLLLIALVALSSCNSEPIAHTVTIEYDIDWLQPIQITVQDGTTLNCPMDPQKDGYVFDCWQTEDGNEYNFETPVTSDLTITAIWKEANCTVTLKDSAGNIIRIDEVAYNSTYKLSTRLGYNVLKCTDDAGNDIPISNDTVTITEVQTTIKVAEKGTYLEYEIGDIGPGGGYIVFDADSTSSSTAHHEAYSSATLGFRYLEIAASDLPVTFVFGYYRTSDDGENTYVNKEDDNHKKIGSGKTNTASLIAKMGSEAYSKETGSDKTRYAALAAAYYNGGGYSDWFLPSDNELAILNELERLGKGNIKTEASDCYWSSTEYDGTKARSGSIFSGGGYASGPNERSSSYFVRPFRSF